MSKFQSFVKGANALLISLFSCIIGFVSLIIVGLNYVIVKPFSLSMYRKITTKLCGGIFLLPSFILQRWSKMKLFSVGDEFPKDSSTLIILNHSSRTDWLLTMVWLSLGFPYPGNARFVTMGPIKKIPIFGWVLDMIEFIFIEGKWADIGTSFKDQLTSMSMYEEQTGYPLALVLFPEGVLLEADKIHISHDYAREKNLPIFYNVLLPRFRGFREMVETLRDHVDYVVDATVAFKPNAPDIYDVLSGSATETIVVKVKKYDMKTMPTDPDRINNWLLQRWTEKEEFLEAEKVKADYDPETSSGIEIKPKYVVLKLSGIFSLFILGTVILFNIAAKIRNGRIDLLIITLILTAIAIGSVVKNLIPDKRHKGPKQETYGATENAVASSD